MNTATPNLFKPGTLSFAAWTAALTTLLSTANSAAPLEQSTAAVLDKRVAVVSLVDLDVSTPQGAGAARERLHETARRLCAQLQDSQDLGHQPRFVACVESTLDAAVRSLTGGRHVHGTQAISPSSPADRAQPSINSPDSRSMKIRLADLDLSTPAGAQVARDRIHEAARRLCSQLDDMDDLGHQPQFVVCVESAMAQAWQRLRGPAVAAVNGVRATQHGTP